MSSVIKNAEVEYCEWRVQHLKRKGEQKLLEEKEAYLNDNVQQQPPTIMKQHKRPDTSKRTSFHEQRRSQGGSTNAQSNVHFS